jgi:hypothetical protein
MKVTVFIAFFVLTSLLYGSPESRDAYGKVTRALRARLEAVYRGADSSSSGKAKGVRRHFLTALCSLALAPAVPGCYLLAPNAPGASLVFV